MTSDRTYRVLAFLGALQLVDAALAAVEHDWELAFANICTVAALMGWMRSHRRLVDFRRQVEVRTRAALQRFGR